MPSKGVQRYFRFIKKQVTSDWKDLAECLEFEAPDIENIEGKHRDDKSRCMELLQEWYKRKGNTATIHVLIEALQEADLKHVVDSLKDKYPELNEKQKLPTGSSEELPVHLNLGTVQQPTTAGPGQGGDINARVLERLLEVERTLFTEDVLRDPRLYEQTREIFLSHKALLRDSFTGSIILLLMFLRQTDVDRFYHNHYRVGEGTLSQQLSHILISDDLQDKVKGAQLIVRLQVKHKDYERVRDRLGQGLDRTTSVDNLLVLPPPSRHMECSSLIRGLDLAVIGREDQPFTDRADDDITSLYRQVQSVVQTTREKSKQEVKAQLETMQGQVTQEVKMLKEKNDKALLEQRTEMKEKIQQLQEVNNSMEARIEELLNAKKTVKGRSQQKDPVQTMSVQQSKTTNTGQVKQLVVQSQGRDTPPIWVGQPWVRKVRFGGMGSGRGEFNYPLGVAVSQDHEVYIADWLNSRIQVFTMDGVYIIEFTTTLPGETGEKLEPQDVAVDRNDNLWVVSDEHVVQYSREGTSLVKIDLPCVEGLHGITVAMATEQVIVTEDDEQNGRLRVFNQDGSEVRTYDSGHTCRSLEPWLPRYVTVDGEGNILVTDYRNHCVHVLDGEGNFLFKFGSEGSDESQLKKPQGICVDGMGNMIVADYGNGCVKMFDSQGRFLCRIGSDMMGPCSVTMSPGGDVVVTDWADHTVSILGHRVSLFVFKDLNFSYM